MLQIQFGDTLDHPEDPLSEQGAILTLKLCLCSNFRDFKNFVESVRSPGTYASDIFCTCEAIYMHDYTHSTHTSKSLAAYFWLLPCYRQFFVNFRREKFHFFTFFLSFILFFFLPFTHSYRCWCALFIPHLFSAFNFSERMCHTVCMCMCLAHSFVRSLTFIPFAIRNRERSIHFLVIVWCWCYCYYYYCRCCQRCYGWCCCCCCYSCCCWYRSSLDIMGPEDHWQC